MPFGGVGYIMSIGLFRALAALQGGAGLRAYEVRGRGCNGKGSVARQERGSSKDSAGQRRVWAAHAAGAADTV